MSNESAGNCREDDRITVPISDYAEMVMQPEHDSAQAVLNTLGNPYRYAHCLDQRA